MDLKTKATEFTRIYARFLTYGRTVPYVPSFLRDYNATRAQADFIRRQILGANPPTIAAIDASMNGMNRFMADFDATGKAPAQAESTRIAVAQGKPAVTAHVISSNDADLVRSLAPAVDTLPELAPIVAASAPNNSSATLFTSENGSAKKWAMAGAGVLLLLFIFRKKSNG